MGHKVRPAGITDGTVVLNFAEHQSKDGSPTFHPPLNLHYLLRESLILPLVVPSTLHSTLTSAWLGLAIVSRTGLRRVRIMIRATQVQ